MLDEPQRKTQRSVTQLQRGHAPKKKGQVQRLEVSCALPRPLEEALTGLALELQVTARHVA